MGNQKDRPLSLEEAKLRLRLAAHGGGGGTPSCLLTFLKLKPKQATLAAFIIGLVLGKSRAARGQLGAVALSMFAKLHQPAASDRSTGLSHQAELLQDWMRRRQKSCK